ncbi:hypothetical protein DYI37_07380 [Fulvimarina endophytica]|uniref:C-type lysozyme inhibitor domain-containing protein n=1 Tax=Fulvimarina endophytica TaxID=2293836 RepID=A0A371X4M5_9HYPH|nr:MliC family protein [Fulvimarina endophytica]RFC64170.1 hypothetical protein DYI37_07380 [Fulvimarina endophytica]
MPKSPSRLPQRLLPAASLLALCLCGPASAATSEDVTVTLTGPVDRQLITYECRRNLEEEPVRIEVDFLNMPNANLAIVPVDGEPIPFALTVSASGSKYVSRSLVWWTRGNRGDLYDEFKGGIGEAQVCRVVRNAG